jgi:hypothetical protein
MSIAGANDGGVFPPLELSMEQKSFVRNCVNVLLTLSRVFHFDSTGYSPKGTYDHWIYCAAVVGDPLKFVKWKISAYYSFHKGQDIPDRPGNFTDNPGVLLGGRAYKYLNLMRRTNGMLFESFITSVLYSKKGMPRPSKEYIKKSEKAAFEKLTKPVPARGTEFLIQWGDVEEEDDNFVLDVNTVKQQISRTVHELFDSAEYSELERIEPFFPSTSANYINSRSEMGAVAACMSDEIMSGLRIKPEESLIKTTISKSRRHQTMRCETVELRAYFMEFYRRVCKKADSEEPLALPLGLPEALKVRVISKGPPFLYTMLKPLQKKLWSVLKDHPCFRLIGRPETAEYIHERMGANLPEGKKFLSVDYTDATNEMMSFCSNESVRVLSDILKLSEEERRGFYRAMTEHVIEYDEEKRKQTMGQLMGSIVSFPILCIVNAAICRWAMEISDKRHWSLKDIPLAINGDDAVMKINEKGREIWAKIGSFCGLSPSIGKVYYSEQFLNLNSATFHYHREGFYSYYALDKKNECKRKRTCNYELIKYVNLGLLFGLKRSGGKVSVFDNDEFGTFGSKARKLISSCPDSLQERVLCQFLHIQNSKLKVARIPWFIPESLGGLGLPTVGTYQPCNKDLRLARKIYEHYKLPSRPKPGQWKIWQVAQSRVKFVTGNAAASAAMFLPDVHGLNNVISESTLLGLYCVECLFRSTPTELFAANADSSRGMTIWLRKIQGVWKKALLDDIPFPEPFNMDRLPIVHSTSDIPYIFENASFIEPTHSVST